MYRLLTSSVDLIFIAKYSSMIASLSSLMSSASEAVLGLPMAALEDVSSFCLVRFELEALSYLLYDFKLPFLEPF